MDEIVYNLYGLIEEEIAIINLWGLNLIQTIAIRYEL